MIKFVSASIAAFTVAVGSQAAASEMIDSCASALKPDELTFTSDIAANLAYLNTVKSDTYNEESASAALGAIIDAVPMSMDFSSFSKKRANLFKMIDYRFNQRDQRSFLMKYLSATSAESYNHCVSAVLKNPGLHLTPVSETPEVVTFRIYFQGEQDAGSYDLDLTVSGGKVKTKVRPRWKGLANQTVTVDRSVKNGTIIIDANASVKGAQRFGDSLAFVQAPVYVRKVKSEKVTSATSSAACGQAGARDERLGNTVELRALGDNQYLTNVAPVTTAYTGHWHAASGSVMKMLTQDEKLVTGAVYCIPGNPGIDSGLDGQLTAVLETISFARVEPAD